MADKDEISVLADTMKENGIINILALRGDIPKEMEYPKELHYVHATDLVKELRSLGGFCIGGACYPESHIESRNQKEDIQYLKEKVDAGCDFLTTQMFFDNHILYNFLYRALQKGITLPICAGIMPVVNAKQIKRITALSGAGLPPRFAAIVDRFGGNPASMREAGIAYATEQIIDLIAGGVNRIHLYTMNKPDIAAAIFGNLRAILGANSHA